MKDRKKKWDGRRVYKLDVDVLIACANVGSEREAAPPVNYLLSGPSVRRHSCSKLARVCDA